MVEERGDDTTGDPREREPPHPGRDASAGAGLAWHPTRVRRVMGIRLPVVSLRSTTGYLLRNPRFRSRDPMWSVPRGAKVSLPCIGMPGVFGVGERMGALGSIRLPLHPRPRTEP